MTGSRLRALKITALVAAIFAYFPILFVSLGFLAQDTCLDRGGTLTGPWAACMDGTGRQWTWLGLLNPHLVMILAAAIGLGLAIAVRWFWRKLDSE